MRKTLQLLFVLGLLLLSGCTTSTSESGSEKTSNTATFIKKSGSQTGINFTNRIKETAEKNVLNYEYFYNGGGVAIGDFNGDQKPDVYFTGNMVENKLYLNQGGLSFQDVTAKAGVEGRKGGWTTGTTLVDINADGLLDIYLCYSGDGNEDVRRNTLYINQGLKDGVPTFKDEAAKYGLDLPTHSTQALFFDYDKDGDLDVYILNHSIEDFQNFNAAYVKKQRDPNAGDRLLRNDKGLFTDVSEQAGIKGTPLGFGLGIAASDVNNDGWIDLYISNDYIEEDYLYINQKDGTFQDQLPLQLGHISHFSMGSNIADINNDGWMDIFTLDMLPEDNRRQKLLYGPDTYEKYQYMLRNGFYHQIMRNMLQLNNGDGSFSEIGQLANISNTDWSWSPVFADFDNDGWQDLFITNGYLRDYTNRDFVSYYADQRFKEQRGQESDALMDIIAKMPSTQTSNYLFRNQRDLTFEDKSEDWGFGESILSNGAVAVDLDQDGDLDLVVNNLNKPASIFENQVSEGHYLKVSLQGKSPNNQAIGSKVQLKVNDQWATQEFIPSRGFQSSVAGPLHFGLGKVSLVDSLIVRWPDGSQTVQTKVSVDQTIQLSQEDGQKGTSPKKQNKTLFQRTDPLFAFRHQENPGVDLKKQPLLSYALSYQGPSAVAADFTGDGKNELFVGGAKMQAPTFFVQATDGAWEEKTQNAFTQDLIMEDVTATAFDADEDGDLDLYAASGGYHFLEADLALQDRLYINDGQGNFTKSMKGLPIMRTSTGAVAAADFDQDGDMDLFVGGRLIPGQYPKIPRSYLLENQGEGNFKDVTEEVAPALLYPGLVTATIAEDLNGDKIPDLLLAGEWMPLTAVINQNGEWQVREDFMGEATSGWWQSLHLADLDGDGDCDIIAGNLGENTNLKVKPIEPAQLYVGDYDDNGTIDPLLTHYIQGAPFPFYSRDNLLGQLTHLRKKFVTYESYSDARIEDILEDSQIEQTKKMNVQQGASVWIENQGAGSWVIHKLPVAAQMSPVFAIHTSDLNQDGKLDILLAGNLAETRPSMGPWDANYGQVFLNRGDYFEYLPQHQSGLQLIGDVRSVLTPQKGAYIFFRNNQPPQFYQLSANYFR